MINVKIMVEMIKRTKSSIFFDSEDGSFKEEDDEVQKAAQKRHICIEVPLQGNAQIKTKTYEH